MKQKHVSLIFIVLIIVFSFRGAVQAGKLRLSPNVSHILRERAESWKINDARVCQNIREERNT